MNRIANYISCYLMNHDHSNYPGLYSKTEPQDSLIYNLELARTAVFFHPRIESDHLDLRNL